MEVARLGATKNSKRSESIDLRNKIQRKKPKDARALLRTKNINSMIMTHIKSDARQLLQKKRSLQSNRSKVQSRSSSAIKIRRTLEASLAKQPVVSPTLSPTNMTTFLSELTRQIGGANSIAQPNISPIQGFRVEINNLQHSVTLDDVYELFSGVGQLRSCRLLKSGSAEVVFNSANDALEAVNRYNGRELDHRPMRVELVTLTSGTTSTTLPSRMQQRLSTANLRPEDVDTDVVQQALFNAASREGNRRRPVDFKVNLV